MTVRIPITIPRPELPTEECTAAWKNYWNSLCVDGRTVLSESELYHSLHEWRATLLRSERLLEFETGQDAVMWILRWS